MTFAWSPGGDFGSPTYTLPIVVVDGVRSTFIGKRRRQWKAELDQALLRWQLPFELRFRPEADQPWVADDTTIGTLSVNPLIIPNAIALVRLHSSVNSDTAGWIQEMGGGICLLSPWRGWWISKGQIAQVAAHEIGHALGFGHGGTGIMVGAFRPNDQERTLAKAYYGT